MWLLQLNNKKVHHLVRENGTEKRACMQLDDWVCGSIWERFQTWPNRTTLVVIWDSTKLSPLGNSCLQSRVPCGCGWVGSGGCQRRGVRCRKSDGGGACEDLSMAGWGMENREGFQPAQKTKTNLRPYISLQDVIPNDCSIKLEYLMYWYAAIWYTAIWYIVTVCCNTTVVLYVTQVVLLITILISIQLICIHCKLTPALVRASGE